MHQAIASGEGVMLSVFRVDQMTIEQVCQSVSMTTTISCYNSPEQIVVSGLREDVKKVEELLRERGASVKFLDVSAPFHSPLMEPIAAQFADELAKYKFNTLDWPVISNVTAKAYSKTDGLVPRLTAQLTHPVQWQSSMQELQRLGVTHAIELGPQTVLRNLMRFNAPNIRAFSFDKEDDRKSLRKELKREIEVAPRIISKTMAIASATRNRNFDQAAYQTGVIEPYRVIQQIQEELDRTGQNPTVEQMHAAIDMLQSVFTTKQVPIEEQRERFDQLFQSTGVRYLFPDFQMPKKIGYLLEEDSYA